MKANIVAGIVCAAVIAAASGCDNQEGMGADLLPASDMANIVVDTIEVKAYTELESPVASSNMTYMLVGEFKDPNFGKTETSFAAKFSNSSYGKYTADDICDSVVLTLGVDTTATYYYGDSLTDITVDVFRLTKPINDTIRYYNNYDISGDYDAAVKIASTTFKPREIDSMVTFKFAGNEQTLLQYGKDIIQSTLDTTFDQNICGLYFKVKSGNSIVKFYRSSNNTQYIVYHHIPGKDTVSSSVVYSIQSTDCTFNLSSHDYTGTKLENVTSLASGVQDDYLYLQSMNGTRIRIDITGIDKIKCGTYFSLRGAHLVAPLADSAYSQQKDFPAIDYVVCVGLDKNNRDSSLYFDEFTLNMSGSKSINILSRDATNNCYRLNMTGRVNDLLERKKNGVAQDYDIYLYPNSRTTDFNRSVICSPVNKQTPMKLVVEYANYDM